MAKMKEKILNLHVGTACYDYLYIRGAGSLYSAVKTEMNDAQNRAISLFCEDIGYALTLLNNSSKSLIGELLQPAHRCLNAEAKRGVKEEDKIPLVLVYGGTAFVVMCKEMEKGFRI